MPTTFDHSNFGTTVFKLCQGLNFGTIVYIVDIWMFKLWQCLNFGIEPLFEPACIGFYAPLSKLKNVGKHWPKRPKLLCQCTKILLASVPLLHSIQYLWESDTFRWFLIYIGYAVLWMIVSRSSLLKGSSLTSFNMSDCIHEHRVDNLIDNWACPWSSPFYVTLCPRSLFKF